MASVIFPDEVKNSALFAGLTEQDKNALLSGGKIRKIPKGQMIYVHTYPVTSFYIISDGTIKLFRESTDGHEKTTDVLTVGHTMCEKEFFDPSCVHRVNAEAITDAVLMEFPVSWLRENAKKHPIFALNLLSAISRDVHIAEIEAEHLATMSAAQLVACFLQRMCILYNFNPEEFELPYSKGLIASRLGMEIETFSRTLLKLRDNGVTVVGTKVKFNDLEAIEQYVCGKCSAVEECPTHKAMQKKINDDKNATYA